MGGSFGAFPFFTILLYRPRFNDMAHSKNNFLSGHPIIAQLLAPIPKEIFTRVLRMKIPMVLP
jgi:hypothetical protein